MSISSQEQANIKTSPQSQQIFTNVGLSESQDMRNRRQIINQPYTSNISKQVQQQYGIQPTKTPKTQAQVIESIVGSYREEPKQAIVVNTVEDELLSKYKVDPANPPVKRYQSPQYANQAEVLQNSSYKTERVYHQNPYTPQYQAQRVQQYQQFGSYKNLKPYEKKITKEEGEELFKKYEKDVEESQKGKLNLPRQQLFLVKDVELSQDGKGQVQVLQCVDIVPNQEINEIKIPLQQKIVEKPVFLEVENRETIEKLQSKVVLMGLQLEAQRIKEAEILEDLRSYEQKFNQLNQRYTHSQLFLENQVKDLEITIEQLTRDNQILSNTVIDLQNRPREKEEIIVEKEVIVPKEVIKEVEIEKIVTIENEQDKYKIQELEEQLFKFQSEKQTLYRENQELKEQIIGYHQKIQSLEKQNNIVKIQEELTILQEKYFLLKSEHEKLSSEQTKQIEYIEKIVPEVRYIENPAFEEEKKALELRYQKLVEDYVTIYIELKACKNKLIEFEGVNVEDLKQRYILVCLQLEMILEANFAKQYN